MTHNRWKTSIRVLALIAVLGMLPAAPATSALQPADAPTVDGALMFDLGEVVLMGDLENGEQFAYAPAVFNGEITDSKGTWEVGEQPNGGPAYAFVSGETNRLDDVVMVTSPDLEIADYDGRYGGGSTMPNYWYVEATNPGTPAATATLRHGADMSTIQQDGQVLGGHPPIAAVVTTKGKWLTRNCKCWLGGTDIRTFQKWARVELTATVAEGQVIAVVMPMAPNRGEAKFKLDGVNQGRVDTYSAVKRNRVIVWQTPPLEAGSHTVSVINLATSGRARIDVDAFLMTEGIHP